MRIDRREQLMVVNLYPDQKHETMLPYKMQQEIYTEDYTSASTHRSARLQGECLFHSDVI